MSTMMRWERLLNPERPRKSTSTGDNREQFERDFDRAVFSNPVKRLQDKAQVFPLESHDGVRTRLTHSLEVSAVAKGLAIAVTKKLRTQGKIKAGMERQIEAIAATCGLIHDLGNPPFGHAGEDAIREWFERRFENDLLNKLNGEHQLAHDFLKFEGNAQTLRLVSKLQVLADFNGLNLTFGTLSAACKYIASSTEVNKSSHSRSKPGYFFSENELISTIRDQTGTDANRNPITFLVEAADDIVYAVADLEDGIKKKIISWKEVEAILFANLKRKDIVPILKIKNKILKAGRSSVPKDLPDDRHASAFRTAAIGRFVEDASNVFMKRYNEIMSGSYDGELVKDCESNALMTVLKKEIGGKIIYCTAQTLKLELMGRKIIQDLMDLFWEGAQEISKDGTIQNRCFPGKLANLLSENYRKVFVESRKRQPKIPVAYHQFQLVTDYICGMTDTFAKQLHSELLNG